jgi:PTS system nitrogen regulatory IIA component
MENQAEQSSKGVRIGALLAPERILILKGKRSKTEVLDALIDSLVKAPGVGAREELAFGIFHREGLMSTGIGNGLAAPHVRLPNVDSSYVALGICPDGVADYQSLDSQPVRLVFMIVVKKDLKSLHLKILASISSLFYDGRLKAAILAANDPATCLEIFARAER